MKKIIAFDCDSTLSAIEGVDELARLKSDATFHQVEDLTNQAMNGQVPVEEVFARRLELIQPSQEDCAKIGQMYLQHIEPSARQTIHTLQKNHWDCLIISGGFTPCIQPLAQDLGIQRIEAVPLHFDPDGHYLGFDQNYPTTRDGGKPEVISQIKKELTPDLLIMVGDGVSDLETTPHVNHFIAYTGYVAREKVLANSTHHITKLSEIPDLINSLGLPTEA